MGDELAVVGVDNLCVGVVLAVVGVDGLGVGDALAAAGVEDFCAGVTLAGATDAAPLLPGSVAADAVTGLDFRPFDAAFEFLNRGMSERTIAGMVAWTLAGMMNVLAPGSAIKTSSRFPLCSTCAVAPGCNVKHSNTRSPFFVAVTVAKLRPRNVSTRGTSDTGIRT